MEQLRLHVASLNQVKLRAVQEIFSDWYSSGAFCLQSIDVDSGVSEQPCHLQEIIDGATRRATRAFMRCDFSIGIEGGIFVTDRGEARYYQICCCVIHDGNRYYKGFSPAFSVPEVITERMFSSGIGINQALHELGYTNDPQIGASIGVVGLLSAQRIQRLAFIKQAVAMALISAGNLIEGQVK